MDKVRPAVILTRAHAVSVLSGVVVAPVTSRIRGLPVEVPVGPHNGIERPSVVNCDQVTLVTPAQIGRSVGLLNDAQEAALAEAITYAFGFDPVPDQR